MSAVGATAGGECPSAKGIWVGHQHFPVLRGCCRLVTSRCSGAGLPGFSADLCHCLLRVWVSHLTALCLGSSLGRDLCPKAVVRTKCYTKFIKCFITAV